MATHDEATARLRVALRARLRTGDATVLLTAADAQLLLDELGRLQQGNDRLRRQNRRLRRRLQAAVPGMDPGPDGEPVEDTAGDGDAPSTDADNGGH